MATRSAPCTDTLGVRQALQRDLPQGHKKKKR